MVTCQAKHCSTTAVYTCPAWISTPPPTRAFVIEDLVLCEEHANKFSENKSLMVILEGRDNESGVLAQWVDDGGYSADVLL